MKRIVYMEMAGKFYPLSFSLGATKAITMKFGSMDKMMETISSLESISTEAIDSLVYIISALECQGCAYMNVFCKNLPVNTEIDVAIEGMKTDKKKVDISELPIIDGEWIPLTTEEIECVIDISDLGAMTSALMCSFRKSQETDVEVASKNAKAPQGKGMK